MSLHTSKNLLRTYFGTRPEEKSYLKDIEKLTKRKIEVITHPYHSKDAQNTVGVPARAAPKNNRWHSKKFKSRHRPKRRFRRR